MNALETLNKKATEFYMELNGVARYQLQCMLGVNMQPQYIAQTTVMEYIKNYMV